ncbi:Methyltransferase-like protein [Eumeta japonica]|uniref:Methyltransferase-like protein n=1 Tax=Eumeta variegata TaxID=151549 RepID=A0A4C1ZMQ2_EUMVA|nr:Methyltransferase-like protein [Eumeta japonica]
MEVSSNETRPQFGNRYLENVDEVFKHNAWDNVSWDTEQEEAAKSKVMNNSQILFTQEYVYSLEENASKHWDAFYDIHQNRFFKDRHWLFTEFPELAPDHTSAPVSVHSQNSSSSDNDSKCDTHKLNYLENTKRVIFEIGCGVGNTIFPILQYSQDPNLFIYGCDFSSKAIDIIKGNPSYDVNRCNVFVLDATLPEWDVPFPHNSLDIVVLIFVLSAIEPKK